MQKKRTCLYNWVFTKKKKDVCMNIYSPMKNRGPEIIRNFTGKEIRNSSGITQEKHSGKVSGKPYVPEKFWFPISGNFGRRDQLVALFRSIP